MDFPKYESRLVALGYSVDAIRAVAKELGKELVRPNHDVNATWRAWLTRVAQAAPNETARESLNRLADLLVSYDTTVSFEGSVASYEEYVKGLSGAKHVLLMLHANGEMTHEAIAATIKTPISGFTEVFAKLQQSGLIHVFGDERARPISLTYALTDTGYRCADRLKP